MAPVDVKAMQISLIYREVARPLTAVGVKTTRRAAILTVSHGAWP